MVRYLLAKTQLIIIVQALIKKIHDVNFIILRWKNNAETTVAKSYDPYKHVNYSIINSKITSYYVYLNKWKF